MNDYEIWEEVFGVVTPISKEYDCLNAEIAMERWAKERSICIEHSITWSKDKYTVYTSDGFKYTARKVI